MNTIDWLELKEEAPMMIEICAVYFQERYMGNWQSRMDHPQKLLEFLRTKGIGIQILGINLNWICKVWMDESLIFAQRDFPSEDEAFQAAIKEAFTALEHKIALI